MLCSLYSKEWALEHYPALTFVVILFPTFHRFFVCFGTFFRVSRFRHCIR